MLKNYSTILIKIIDCVQNYKHYQLILGNRVCEALVIWAYLKKCVVDLKKMKVSMNYI